MTRWMTCNDGKTTPANINNAPQEQTNTEPEEKRYAERRGEERRGGERRGGERRRGEGRGEEGGKTDVNAHRQRTTGEQHSPHRKTLFQNYLSPPAHPAVSLFPSPSPLSSASRPAEPPAWTPAAPDSAPGAAPPAGKGLMRSTMTPDNNSLTATIPASMCAFFTLLMAPY